MHFYELDPFIRNYPRVLSQAIRDGSYRPSPVKRVYTLKDNGEKRPLGIPTVVDRLVEQAIAQKLSEEYEPKFSDNSFGFRPNRCAHDALKRIVDNANDGYEHVIDLDLAKFFEWGNSSKAYWRVAGSWILKRSLTNDVLQNLGWIWLGTARKWSPL